MEDLESRVRPGQTALLVVDMQNDFCHREGELNKAKEIIPYYSVEMTEAMLPALRRTLEAARRVGVRVIFVRSEYSDQVTSPVWKRRHLGKPLRTCQPGSWGADWYAVSPLPDEAVVVKHRYSPFVNTSLETLLRAQEIRTLVIVGNATNVCVESTARDAFMRDYDVVVLFDCVATSEPSVHEHSLKNIGRHFGTVIPSEELLRAWKLAP
jgi:ureidoacrylate peracid hydrolase